MKLRKGDIFNVALEGLDISDEKVRPCIIINANKSLIKDERHCTILPLTSNLKRILKHNTVIEGFGLSKPSKVLTERICSINTNRLLDKIGHIDNIQIMKGVNDCVSKYLDISRNEKIEVEDLLNMLTMTNKDLEIIKIKLYTNFLEKNYITTKDLANELIKSSIGVDDNYVWLGYYTLALVDLELKTGELINIEKAMQYVKLDNVKNYRLSLWAYANSIKDEDRAINIYKELADSYKLTGNKIEHISCLWNICKIKKNIKRMEKILNIVRDIKFWNYLITKELFIKELELELISL